MLLGCIADDFTGATDLASMLVKHGMRTVQRIGVPGANEAAPDSDAVVVALKSRTAPVRDAVAESLAALAWLRDAGCRNSSSSIARPSTARTKVISGRWRMRCLRRWAPASHWPVRRFRRMRAVSTKDTCSSAACC